MAALAEALALAIQHHQAGRLSAAEPIYLEILRLEPDNAHVLRPGETFASRHSFGHLSNAGLTDTIARDMDEYIEPAVSLAGDPVRLAGLRERTAASPLCDGERFAGHLMALLHDVWERSMG